MGYFNPFMRYGQERFVVDAARAGADGLIVPDLPLEDGARFAGLCRENGLHLIPMLAPTSTDRRIELACNGAGGFIYCVSLTGVTGARPGLRYEAAARLVERIRGHTDLPTIVGFGVSSPEHLEEIARFADGAIVASALLDAIGEAPLGEAAQTAREFVTKLKRSAG
jgi:tryptophan synthase alpha chain